MRNGHDPIVKDLVLVGGGHSHVAVLKRFGMEPLPGVRLTLICRESHTPYSGMLPGLIAGHYTVDEAHIDLGPLSRFAGARFFHDDVIGIDLEGRRVLCRNRPPTPYDVLSINTGSTPRLSEIPGAAGAVVPVKPISRFLDRWQMLVERALARTATRVAVVGAGAGGVEIALAAQHRLRSLLGERGRSDGEIEFHLFTDTDEILPTHNARVRAMFRRVLAERAVQVHAGKAVIGVEPGRLTTRDGAVHAFDEILWVTAAGAAPWLGKSGLALDAEGFIAVASSLRSISHPDVFAAGDVAAMIDHPRPKSGVFAVRQGPPLARNLRRALLGKPLESFRPQRRFLSLITTGDRYAIASRGAWAMAGRSLWLLKDRIDRRFMRKYNELPEMTEPVRSTLAPGLADGAAIKELSAFAMRCGGCGAKVGSTVLSNALAQLRPVQRDRRPDRSRCAGRRRRRLGAARKSDGAYRRPLPCLHRRPLHLRTGRRQSQPGRHLRHGRQPQSALAIVTLPYGIEKKLEEQLFELMSGALKVLDDADTALVGGHTSEGLELSLGFAINGFADPRHLLRKAGMRPGDRLILTKPLGTGTLFAADMRGKAKARWIEAALASMLQSNRQAAECLHAHDATACTDVTGFGLLGHLVEMVRASGVDVALDLEALPLLQGAVETIHMGIFSSLQPQNLRLRRAVREVERAAADERYALLFDPQTAGGLLASIPDARAEACLTRLKSLGYADAAIIGAVAPASNHLEPVTLHRNGHAG